jgi:multiple sugar transport system permease protein
VAPRRSVQLDAALRATKVRAGSATVRDVAVDRVDVISGETATASEPIAVVGSAVARVRRRDRFSPVGWARSGGLAALAFALPMLVIFTAFSWYPIVRLVVLSFQQTNLIDPPAWVGLGNFREVISDPLFLTAVKNTAYFAGLALVFGYPIPLVAAVLVSESRRFRGIYSGLAYLPVVLPPVVGVLLWKYVFYEPSSVGLFNTVLGWVHLGPYGWLQSPGTAMPALVVEATWANAGATVIIYLAALAAVDTDLYDAASVDGAGIWRKIWHITLPQLRGVLLVTLMLQIIGTAQVFLEPFLFTSGGPANSTLTVLLLVYQYAFGNSVGVGFGQAAALSLMIAAFLAVFSVAFMRLTRSWSTT